MTTDLASVPAADLIAAIQIFPKMIDVMFYIIAAAICFGGVAVIVSLCAKCLNLRKRTDLESKKDKQRVDDLRRRMSPHYAAPATKSGQPSRG